jgi:hypothetical protein
MEVAKLFVAEDSTRNLFDFEGATQSEAAKQKLRVISADPRKRPHSAHPSSAAQQQQHKVHRLRPGFLERLKHYAENELKNLGLDKYVSLKCHLMTNGSITDHCQVRKVVWPCFGKSLVSTIHCIFG